MAQENRNLGRTVAAMMSSSSSSSSWSNLPEDLLKSIAKRIDTEINILRFRAVCPSWRSSVARPNYPNRPLPLKLPLPIVPIFRNECGFFALSEDTVYLVQLPDNEEVNACTSLPQQERRRQGWLVRVRQEFPGKFHVFSPILKRRVDYFPETFPRDLNMLNFRVTEVCKLYDLRFVDPSPSPSHPRAINISKVLLSGNSISTDRVVFAMHGNGDLCFLRLGYEKWTVVQHVGDVFYHDIAIRDDQFYAVDDEGMLSVFDSSFNKIATLSSPSVDGTDNRSFYLVESLGDILLVVFRNVDSFGDLIDYDQRARGFTKHRSPHVMVRTEVYKLNEKEGNWSEVRDLGDRILFLGYDGCWSVSAHDFAGCKGNCIYFYAFWNAQIVNPDNRLRGLNYREIGVYNLEDGTGGPLASYPGYADVFWPPPTWLNSNTS